MHKFDDLLRNFDAGFKRVTKEFSSSVVVRDDDGLALGSCVHFDQNISDPFAVEALACVHVVRFALELGFSNLLVKGNSKMVITKLTLQREDGSNIRPRLVGVNGIGLQSAFQVFCSME
ncbi:hypothetical protein Golob_007593 [Gossypium lobatum]|uniref:RNase H type-1 domain-containing protein n=1 Tax=Gossypium lobatum TaxID=34289 RepID=A0A7J8MCV6_9ROSI|nr:hypothetical protein [Gossypium lobatum]